MIEQDRLRGYSVAHEIDGSALHCDRCGQQVHPAGYSIELLELVAAAEAHSPRCLG